MCDTCNAIFHVSRDHVAVGDPCPLDGCGGKVFQRSDDEEGAIRQRLNVYKSQTETLIGYYEVKGQLVRINALGAVEEVNERVGAALAERGLL